MDNFTLIRCFGLIIFFSGLAVMFGWIIDSSTLKSILPIWSSMSFFSALCISFSGLLLIAMAVRFGKNFPGMTPVILFLSFFMVLFAGAQLLSLLTGFSSGIEGIVVYEEELVFNEIVAGRPSAGSLLGFFLLGLSGLTSLTYPYRSLRFLFQAGVILVVISSVALIGYIFDLPLLYYSTNGVSNPMSFHLAFLLLMSGIAVIRLERSVTEGSL